MESIGSKLRTERLRKGLSLDAVSAKTRIPLRTLEAIEEDQHEKVSPAFFYRSFVRQFAQVVGTPYAELAPAVDQRVASMGEPPLSHPPHDPMLPKIAPLDPIRPKKFRWLFSVVALLGVLFACSGLYAMWQDAKAMNRTPSAPQAILYRPAN